MKKILHVCLPALLLLCAFTAKAQFPSIPIITSFSPASGPVGTLVTVNGNNLTAANASLTIGGKSAIIVSATGSTMTALVMPGATTGIIAYNGSSGGALSASNFTVKPDYYPSTQQGAKLVSNDNAGPAAAGWSVAISADGNTAIVGGYADNDDQGAVWIYTRNNGVWTQQGSKLTVNDNVGASEFGYSVAISADGNTAIAGGYFDNTSVGAAWIFTRTGTTWTQQGTKLVGSGYVGPYIYEGTSVALSADGNTAVIGGSQDNNGAGATWVFTRSNGTWTQSGNKLVGTGAATAYPAQGNSVAISADASTIIVGASNDNNAQGGAFIFAKNGNTWLQQGAKLFGTGAVGNAYQGNSVTLSADGNTALVGGPFDNSYKGATWVFTRSGTTWSQQGSKLTGTSNTTGNELQGNAVALSADGNMAIIAGNVDNGDQGAAWVFTRNAGTWAQQGNKLVGTGVNGAGQQGQSVGLSADGLTAIVGGPNDASGTPGAAWIFTASDATLSALTLSVDTLVPMFNPATTSYTANVSNTVNSIAVTPTANNSGATVTVNGAAVSSGTASAPITINSATTPVNVVVTSPDGSTTQTYTLNIAQIPPPAISSISPASGPVGTLVTITGTNLTAPTTFTIGGTPAVVVSNTGTTLTALVMPGAISGAVSLSTSGGSAQGGSNFTVTPTQYASAQQGSKLVGTGTTSSANQGFAVAVSADGNTAVVGGPNDINNNNYTGAAWVYTRSAGVWTQQGSKLLPADNNGQANAGTGVAISADGNTIVLGGPADNTSVGAAWIFTRSSGTWTQQGSKLTASDGSGTPNFGQSTGISADGNTVVIGGNADNGGQGAVWIFTRSNGTWTQQGNKLTGNDATTYAQEGQSAAISADGNTVAFGGPNDYYGTGAIWIFTRSGTTWTQQGAKLAGTDGAFYISQGTSVALSADGNTAITGANYAGSGTGAAWVFTRSGTTWAQQGNKLVGTGITGNSYQGYAVGLSADGNIAMIGGALDNTNIGATWIFARNAGTWTQQGSKLVGTGYSGQSNQGRSLALSADATTLLIGGPYDNNSAGAGWIFTSNDATLSALTTSVDTLTPIFNPLTTNYTVNVGYNINSIAVTPTVNNTGASVTVNGTAVTSGSASAAIALTVGNNTIPVVVTAPGGSSTQTYTLTVVRSTPASIASVTPSSGPVGTLVTINGSGLLSPTTLTIGGVPALVINNDGATLTALVMPGATTGGVSFTSESGTASGSFTVGATPYPSAQQGAKLVGTGNTGASSQGYSVAVSADGNTAVVGGERDNQNQGAAWIYTRSGNTWTQQGSKLVGTGNTGAANQGISVAISADGNTVIVGGYKDHASLGAAWVYTRSNGNWTQQGNKLVGTGSAFNFAYEGFSVGLSADGNTAIVGGYNDNNQTGASWIFVRNNGTWAQQGAKLMASDATGQPAQGYSVALSADGNTAVVGGIYDNNYQGSVWVYTRSAGVWTQQGNKLSGTDGVGQSSMGGSVAVSADGNTVIAGGYSDNSNIGAAWVFTRNNGTWAQQGNKLIGTGTASPASQGLSVSLSADGNTAMVGGGNDNNGIGASWVFTRSNGNWTQMGNKLMGNDYASYPTMGQSVSLSADGTTALVGGFSDNNGIGAAWAYTYNDASLSALTVSPDTISPIFNPATTAYNVNVENNVNSITVTPTVNNAMSTVAVNGTAVNSGSASTAIPLSVGNNIINIVVTAADGITTKTDTLTVVRSAPATITSVSPASGPVGTLVTINGTGLLSASSLSVGGVPAVVISNTSTTITALVMPGATNGNISVAAFGGTASGSSFTTTPTPFPSQQQGSKLVGTGNTGAAQQGYSIAVSADGNTAIVGGYTDNNKVGAAWIYTRSNGTWTQQGTKLVGTGNSGSSYQGWSVAISADGNTAIVGGYHDSGQNGAAWVYTRSAGVWTQQGNKLTANDNTGSPRQGYSVGLSADGNTAILGGYGDNSNQGAAWIYTRNKGTWTQQGTKLVGNDNTGAAYQGWSTALSADGNTAIVGGYADNTKIGAAWIYTRSNGTWAQQGSKLVGSDNNGTAEQGNAVALSADGNTAMIGGYFDNSQNGAAWIFTRSNGAWTQQSNKLVGTGNTGAANQGKSVALSADGNVAIMGGYNDNTAQGALWVFTRKNGAWTQRGPTILGTGNTGAAKQGYAVTLSADATTSLVGGPLDNTNQGAAWVYIADTTPPALTAVNIVSNNANTALAKAGNTVTVTFTANKALATPVVTVDGQPASVTNTTANTWTAVYTLQSTDTEGVLPFNITFADLFGNTASPVTATSDGSKVTFDKTAPATPGNLSGTPGVQQVVLTWATNTETDLQSYKIYSGTSAGSLTLLATVPAGTTTYTNTGLINGTVYYYSISAVDITGNESALSPAITINTSAQQTITFNAIPNAVYGAAPITLGAKASSGLPVTYTSSNTAVATVSGSVVTILSAGSATITASQAGNGSTYQAATPVVQTLTVTKLAVTVTAAAKSKTYGTADPTLTFTVSPALVTGDVATGLLTRTADENVGTYAISQGTLTLSDNYAVTYVPANLTITKAPLTITADNQSRMYGATNPAFTASYSGFVNGETASILTTQPVLTTTATASSLPGSYPVNVSGAAAANYNITYVAGNLTVTPLSNANLNSLAESTGTLSPGFSTGVSNYTVTLPVTINSLTVTLNYDATASATVNGIGVSNGTASSPIVISAGTTTVTIVVTAQDGVTKQTYTIAVTQAAISNAVTATNILSPNGDGKNDTWVIKDIELYPNNVVTIFDRAGRVVYTKKGYNNDWQGTVNNAPLDQGTYYYVIELEPNMKPIKGFVTILRSR